MISRRVVVLAGGFSPERNVSLASASNVALHLRKAGYDATCVDLSRGILGDVEEKHYLNSPIKSEPDIEELQALRKQVDVLRLLQSEILSQCDVVFPVIHGTFGEDGRLQALLNAGNFAYVGSDYTGCALAMNKHLAKQLFVQNRIPTPMWTWMVPGDSEVEIPSFPLIIKPASGGSTVGIALCSTRNDFDRGLRSAFQYDREVIVESVIRGREFTVGVLDGKVLAIGEIRSNVQLFDYKAKYQSASTQEIFPASLPAHVIDQVHQIVQRVVCALRIRHYCRVDFMLDADNQIFVLEANTIPGLTRKSLYPQSAAAAGLSFESVCDQLCRLAVRDRIEFPFG